ncbi:hypothetical protein WN67_31530 [Mycolicibacterium obuense]|uniref:Uncharacterized protein n=1 Tax=Mycolicibacterium obuense TaxID=1807 RepID=A0A0M2WI17_9MYCO|nr:hypothetical protein WN67_31530 [Mycolicibacterium obuense]
MKYTVNMNVVRRASAGNRYTDSNPTADAALTIGSTGRTFSGRPTASSAARTGAIGPIHATASPACIAASTA